MAIAPFPHTYTVSLIDDQLLAPGRTSVAIGAPPQFGGTEPVWSPEDLLAGATLACLKTTFDAYARKEGLLVGDWIGRATATLEKTRAGPAFTGIALEVDLTVAAQDAVRARETVDRAERHCLVSAALKIPITLVVRIDERQDEPAQGVA